MCSITDIFFLFILFFFLVFLSLLIQATTTSAAQQQLAHSTTGDSRSISFLYPKNLSQASSQELLKV